jgi:acetylornithine deacetylase/succinyl-diaminopimelate desuccinylase-like protein
MLLMGHMDVVEARREDWSRDPFTLGETEGYFYGRGTIDMKHGITAVTTALLQLRAEGFQPNRDILVLFTGDEETGGTGAETAANQWLDASTIDFALNADAGGGAFLADGRLLGFGIQTAEKIYQSFTLTATNPGGHSSRPRPDNAIYALAHTLDRLEHFRFEPHLNETTRAYFRHRTETASPELAAAINRWLANENDGEAADFIEASDTEVGLTRTRCVATRLQGGHADNALPQLARATVNCRMFPGTDPATVLATLRTLGEPDHVAVEPIQPAHPTDASPLREDVVGAYTAAVRARHPGAAITPDMSTGATDGLYFRARGVPVYGVDGAWAVIPADERAHGRDERLPVSAFYQDVDHWTDLIRALAGPSPQRPGRRAR